MRLLRGLHNIPAEFKGCAATIGTFDGLHLGHQRIIHSLKAVSERRGVPTLVMLFEPQPKEFFAPDAAPARLANLREKLQDLKAQQVDYVLCLPFNQALRSMSADAFIQDILISALGIKHLIVGDDFRFGCDRRGDYQLLREAGDKYGFEVQDTPTHELDAERISSTRIRTELAANNLVRAAHMLDRSYRMSGRVAYGRQLGRLLDTPTANVMVHRKKLPMTGVYAVHATVEESGEKYQGVANIGVKPTVTGDAKPSLEVHLFDFDGSLYHRHLTVEFAHKIREEKKFDGIDALRAAIENDKQAARQYFSALND
ncbi:MAG: bifunctional riboflavin kinase/FMN adenylyltransferase [Oceanospirillaceae bacterium]|nr:bifunctional riboflavin kinase/FMN adenylyltransferase [Oceanospirillaceae bacterium]MBT11699.1 bifunctional riboflavin kinase/FMN adenylyltransferase [Oceanospirillaceae bacterium]|tara:strand:+ start:62471 stop:63412 length:942 start_codon:yes stop_codon:yes gene_type:complete